MQTKEEKAGSGKCVEFVKVISQTKSDERVLSVARDVI